MGNKSGASSEGQDASGAIGGTESGGQKGQRDVTDTWKYMKGVNNVLEGSSIFNI